MINGYLTVKEVAKKWGVSPKWVQVLCVEGRIEGAAKLGREWAIPVEAERPEAGLERARFPADIATVFVDFTPFGVILRRVAVDSGGQVNRDIDADFLAGVKLGAQEVELEIQIGRASCRERVCL